MLHRFRLFGIRWFYFCPISFKSFIKKKDKKSHLKCYTEEENIHVENCHFHIDYVKKKQLLPASHAI